MGFSFKDKKIIDSNPDKTPYELLELGLSNKAYEKLLQEPIAKPSTPELQPVKVAKETITTVPKKSGGIVTIFNSVTNRTVSMNSAFAAMLVSSQPKIYRYA